LKTISNSHFKFIKIVLSLLQLSFMFDCRQPLETVLKLSTQITFYQSFINLRITRKELRIYTLTFQKCITQIFYDIKSLKIYLTKRGGKLKFTVFSIEDFRASLDLQCRKKSLQRSIDNEAIGRSRDSMYMHSLKL
jgi:hypothetical protein